MRAAILATIAACAAAGAQAAPTKAAAAPPARPASTAPSAPPSMAPLPVAAGFTQFYAAPTKVNMAGRPVVADIALSADMAAVKKGDLRVNLTTDVTKFVDQTEKDLKAYIAGRVERCGERWSSNEPEIAFPNNAIRFRIGIVVEFWQCGLDGKAKPARMTRDSGTIDVTLQPYVEQGKLQARLGAFEIKVTEGMGKYMPLEFIARRAVESELKKLNANPKFWRAPNPLFAETLRYDAIAAAVGADKRVIITARYRTMGKEAALARLAEKMKTQGVTQ